VTKGSFCYCFSIQTLMYEDFRNIKNMTIVTIINTVISGLSRQSYPKLFIWSIDSICSPDTESVTAKLLVQVIQVASAIYKPECREFVF
jgi:hypothetical protein